MGKRVGKNCKVTLGSDKVLGIGTWSMDGISVDEIDGTEFEDDFKQYDMGLKDGGGLSFDGWLDPDDVTGQEALAHALLEGTDLADLRLYVDDTSYYEPNQTAGYFSPGVPTGMNTPVSHVNITGNPINVDKSDLIKVSFTGKCSGVMVLV